VRVEGFVGGQTGAWAENRFDAQTGETLGGGGGGPVPAWWERLPDRSPLGR
jgi:hypothetical protein